MTYIDSQLYHRIESAELLWWAHEQNEHKSKNLVNFTEQFNNVSNQIQMTIIVKSEIQNVCEKLQTFFSFPSGSEL